MTRCLHPSCGGQLYEYSSPDPAEARYLRAMGYAEAHCLLCGRVYRLDPPQQAEQTTTRKPCYMLARSRS